MKKILYTLKEKWAEYLLEILVITIGIMLAFALNNWNENRKEDNFESEVLTNLKNGLKNDLQDLKGNIEWHNRGLEAQNAVLAWLKSEDSYTDTLCNSFAASHIYTTFLSHRHSFETLQENGANMISNEVLRIEITELYENSYVMYNKVENEYKAVNNEMLNNINSRYFTDSFVDINSSGMLGCMHPIDPKNIQQSSEYLYYIKHLKEMNKFVLFHMVKVERKIIKIMKMLDIELQNHD